MAQTTAADGRASQTIKVTLAETVRVRVSYQVGWWWCCCGAPRRWFHARKVVARTD